MAVPAELRRWFVSASAALTLAVGGVAAPIQDDAQADTAVRIEELLAALEAWRGGDPSAAARLDAAAAALVREDGRRDAADVAAFYRSLDDASLRAGVEFDRRFEALRLRWVAWDTADQSGEAPPFLAFAAELEAELVELIAGSEHLRDVMPCARAEALLARLLLALLEAPERRSVDDDAAELLSRAETLARRSERRFSSAGFATPRLEPLWLIGRLARTRGAPDEARAAFLDAAAIAEYVQRDDWRERALLGLLALERDAGDPRAVRAVIEKLARFRDPKSSWALAREHAASLLHADRAAEAAAFLLDHPPLDSADMGLGDDVGPEAREEWLALSASAALRTGQIAAARGFAAELEGSSEHAILARAALDLVEGRQSQVLTRLAPLLAGEVGCSRAGETLARVQCGEALLALGRPVDAAAMLRTALDSARRWESERATSRGSVLGEWVGVHALALLARAELAAGQALTAAHVALVWQSRGLREGAADPTLAELLSDAAATSLGLATWVVGPDFSVALHVDPAGVASGEVLPLGRSAIERGVLRLRQATLARDSGTEQALAAELARALLPRRLFEALAQRTAASSGASELATESLTVVASGVLERLPFGLLALAGGARLADLQALSVLPGHLPRCKAEPLERRTPWVLAGAPCDARGAARLPAATRELSELAQLVEVERVLQGASCTPSALLRAFGGRAPVHVATHLVPSQDPVRDLHAGHAPIALECSDGALLSARELAGRAPALPLVVLSACATADGEVLDGEGGLGLARTFLAHGTRGAIVTLWPIDDGAARAFALALHAELDRGATPAAATAAASRALRASGRPSRDWAAYRYSGQ